MLEWIAHALGVKAQALLAGLAGSATAALFVRGLLWLRRLALVVGGCAAAAYLTDPVAAYLELPPRVELGAAYLVGLLSMSLADAVIRAIAIADLRGWLERKP